ncbi:MAG: hypothetical protein ACE5D8_04100 [Fidelibacterota bacterium]
MKRTQSMITIIVMLVTVGIAFGAGTPAGTIISNTAYGNYNDANGNAMLQVASNTVTTTVSQVAGVSVGPDGNVVTLPSMGSVTVPLTITNTGNDNDVFNLTGLLSSTGSSSYSYSIYSDLNSNGTIDGSDAIVTATTSLAADATFDLIIVITDNGTGVDGDQVFVDITGTSQFDNAVSDIGDITATVSAPVIVVTPTVDNPAPLPGEFVTYTYCFDNTGSAMAYNMQFVGPIPTNTTYSAQSITLDGVSQTDAGDIDDGDYNITNTGQVTVALGNIASGGTVCVTYTVIVNSGVPNSTPILDDPVVTYEDGNNNLYPTLYPSITVTVGTNYAIAIYPDSSASGNPGDELVFIVTVANQSNTSDVINLTFSDAWTWALYLDEGNGTRDGSEPLLTDSNADGLDDAGSIAASSSVTVFAVATIPAGTPDGDIHAFTLTGTSSGNSLVTDYATFTITTTAPFLTLSKSVLPTGNQPPGTVLTYSVTVNNAGSGTATSVVITDNIPANTSYVSGSLTIDSVLKNDLTSVDPEASCDGTVATFNLGQVSSGGSHTVTFQVTIN